MEVLHTKGAISKPPSIIANKEWWLELLKKYENKPLIWNSPLEHKKAQQASTCNTLSPNDEKCFCLMNAINKHDSSWATVAHGKRNNNPCNMRPPKTWTPSVPFTVAPSNFAKFETLEDGIIACTETYDRWYDMLDKDTLVNRWTDNGARAGYRNDINSCFTT